MKFLKLLSVIIVVLSLIKYFYKLDVTFDNNGLHLGTDLCLDFVKGHFSVTRLTLFEHLSNIINTKVKIAYHNNNHKVVFKTCEMVDDNDNNGFLLCDNETLNEIDKNYVNGYWSNLLMLWAASKCGFESIILQILAIEKKWPVSKYYGSCGNIMVTKHSGITLNYFENADWYLRASIALQLLISAKNFTYDHATFQFYLTDVSPYNVAVDSMGLVTHIDLDSLILKIQKDHISQNKVHYSRTEECNDCFKYSASDICASDLLLAEDSPWPMMKNGLLHSIPDSIAIKYPKLKNLIKMCSKSGIKVNRFQAAEELTAILKTISEVKL